MVATRYLLAIAPLLLQEVSAGSSCVCSFDGNDPADCKVLGQFPTRGQPMMWEAASAQCQVYYNVHTDSGVDTKLLGEIWPNGPTELGDADLLIAWLQADETSETSDPISRTIKLMDLGYFFRREYPSSKAPVILKDRLSQGNTVYDCTADQGAACWTLVRNFLKDSSISEDGEHEEVMEGIGTYLWELIEKGKQMGQERTRSAICSDSNAIHAQAAEPLCGALVAQVHDMKEVHEVQDCNAFAIGPDQFDMATVTKCNGGGSSNNPQQQPQGNTAAMTEPALDASAAFTASAVRWALTLSAAALAMVFL